MSNAHGTRLLDTLHEALEYKNHPSEVEAFLAAAIATVEKLEAYVRDEMGGDLFVEAARDDLRSILGATDAVT